jgi:hypothetical protein
MSVAYRRNPTGPPAGLKSALCSIRPLQRVVFDLCQERQREIEAYAALQSKDRYRQAFSKQQVSDLLRCSDDSTAIYCCRAAASWSLGEYAKD